MRHSLLGGHLNITPEALMENLGRRISMEGTAEKREAAIKEGSDSLDKLLDSDTGIAAEELTEYEKLKDKPKELAEKIAKLVFGTTIEFGLDANTPHFKAVFDLNFIEDDNVRRDVLGKAFLHLKMLDGTGVTGTSDTDAIGATSLLDHESRIRLSQATQIVLNKLEHDKWTSEDLNGGSISLDKLLDPDARIAAPELAEYEKLKDKPKKLAEKIATLVFGTLTKFDLDADTPNFKAVFGLDFLEDNQARRDVLDKAFLHFKVLDGTGTTSQLDRESRLWLPPAAQIVLNKLEHDQWTSDDLSPDLSGSDNGKQEAATAHQAELPEIRLTASGETGEGGEAIPQTLYGPAKRAATPTPFDEEKLRAKARQRPSQE